MRKYKLIFLRRGQQAIYVERIEKHKSLKRLLSRAEGQYVIRPDSPSYIDKGCWVYFIDIDSGSCMQFLEVQARMSPEELDNVVSSKIIKDITRGLMDTGKQDLKWAIIGAVIGVLLGIVGTLIWAQQKIDSVIARFLPNSPGGTIF